MKTMGDIRFEVKDNSKELSTDNKVIGSTIQFTHTCSCGKVTVLTKEMFTDSISDRNDYNPSHCGWVYRCECGKVHEINEEAFDNYIEYLYEENLIIDTLSDEGIEELWKELEDVTLDEDEHGILRLANDWNGFSKGTDIEDVWYWFDEHHSKGVGYLMNEYEKE